MGAWNAGLFSNDTTCDVRTTYIEFLKQQLSDGDAYQKTFEEYKELIGTDEEPLFWYALADTQWTVGRLMADVKNTALKFISIAGGSCLWEEDPKRILRWEHTLKKLKEKIESPMPSKKKFLPSVAFDRAPWNTGDIYAYQFHTTKSNECGLFGKYILFQKIGYARCEGTAFSVVQVYDEVFTSVPEIDVLKELRILPLVNPPGVNGTPNSIDEYIPSFQWYMRATMLYEKKVHYPQKYFTFVGKQHIPEKEYAGNEFVSLFWQKDKMEDWLLCYYSNWKNIRY